MVFVIIVATKDNQLVFRDVCSSRNQPFHIISFAAVRNMSTGRFGNTVNGGLGGNPLFGEKIDAVISDNKGLAVEVGGLRVSGEIGLVFVGKPYCIYLKFLIFKRFFADSQNLEIFSASAIVAYIPEVQIETGLRNFFCVLVSDFFDAKGFQDSRIRAVNSIETVVFMVIISPIAIIPKE